MAEEITFRTSVGGYKKDDVLEYVENMNEKVFRLEKTLEEDTERYQARIQELEDILRQEEANSQELMEEQQRTIERISKENEQQQEEILSMEAKLHTAYQNSDNLEEEKKALREKLAREILRLRAENQLLKEKVGELEKKVGAKDDYEAVRDVVSDVQYKIAEYVNVINKTQQSLAETYQNMNGIKKKVVAKLTKIEKSKKE